MASTAGSPVNPGTVSTPPKLPVLPRDAVWSAAALHHASVARPVVLIANWTSPTSLGAVATSGNGENSPPAARAAARTLPPMSHATTAAPSGATATAGGSSNPIGAVSGS